MYEKIIPTPEAIIINSQEEVYKSTLKIILSLCENFSVSISVIQQICEIVLTEKEKENEQP